MIRKNIRVDKLTTAHIKEIIKTSKEADGFCFSEEFINYATTFYQREGNHAYTLMVDEKPVMSAGIIKWDEDTGEAWMVASDLFYKYKVLCHRHLKRGLRVLLKEMNFKMIFARVNLNMQTKLNEKWIKSFGFQLKGLERNGDNEYFRYERIL